MHPLRRYCCTICGEQKRPDETWFLVTDNPWEDKLKVLQWEDRLAAQLGVHHACSPSHVEELVVHWMVTGRLDYPFAQVSVGPDGDMHLHNLGDLPRQEVDTKGARQIGELCVHRESLQRALTENPRSLKSILDLLLSALERETVHVRKDGGKAEGFLLYPVGEPA